MEVKQRTLLVSGDNDFGQLCTGNNKPTKKLIEPKLPPELLIQQVAVGYDHTLILTDANELYVCGSNAYGKLGMGKHQEEITKLTRVDFSHLHQNNRRPTLESPFTASPNMKLPNGGATSEFLDYSSSDPLMMNHSLHHLTNIGYGTLRMNSKKTKPVSNNSSTFKLFQSNATTVDANSDLAEFRKRRNMLNSQLGIEGSGTPQLDGDSFSTSAPVTSETFLSHNNNNNLTMMESNTFSSPIGSSGSGSPFGESLERDSAFHTVSSNTVSATSAPNFDASLFDSSQGKKSQRGHVKSNSIATSPLDSVSSPTPNYVKELVSSDGDFRLSVSGEANQSVRIQQPVPHPQIQQQQQQDEDVNIVTTSVSPMSVSIGTPNGLLSPNSDQSNTSSSRRYSDAQPPGHVRYDSASLPTINTSSVKATKHNTRDLGSFDFDNVVFSVGSDPNMTPMSEEENGMSNTVNDDEFQKKRNSGGLKPFGSMLIKQRKTSNANVKDVPLPKLKTENSDTRAQLDFLRDVNQQSTTPNTHRNSNQGQIPPFEIKSIFCGRNNSFILTKDDEIYWCGERSSCYFKRLQDEELEGKKIKIFATSPFADHFLIVTSQQEVLVSGNNSNGQLGDGTTLDCYGFLKKIQFDFGEDYTDEEKKYVDFKFAACGRAHTCIVATLNGGIDVFYSTGNNQFSQLGYALPVERAFFENPPSLPFERKAIKDLACGAQHTIVLTEENEVWACGKGDLGQLGNGSYSPKNVFQKIDLPSNYIFRRVFCGGGFTVLLTNDNTVLRTGGNYYGQAFLGSTEMVCDYKEQKIEKIGSSYKVYSIHPTTLFCIIQVTKTVTTGRKSSKTVETPTQEKEKSGTLKAGMFSSKSKLNLKLDLSGVPEGDDSFRPRTTR